MAQHTAPSSQVTRTVVALAAVFALLHLAGTNDLLSNVTRPVVVGLLAFAGVSAQDAAGELVIGEMRVPWTRDCAGVNILTLLWAITLWTNRAEPLSGRYWLRLVLGVPAALMANIARILTLLGYRSVFFPSVESPQLHYFIGFLWVMPCLPFFIPRAGREPGRYVLETLYIVAALSLVSPFVPAPGGSLVTIATLLLLAQSRYAGLAAGRGVVAAVWVVSAGFIAAASMESLWLPWLLVCPWLARFDRRHAVTRLLLVLGTIPLVSMHPVARWIIAGAALFEVWRLFQPPSVEQEAADSVGRAGIWRALFGRAALALLLVFPFLASSAGGLLRPSLRPPPGAMVRTVAANTYEVRLVGQSPELQLTWYGPSGDGRHHTLPVCMRYRGIRLKPVGSSPAVMTDGRVWMREFFICQNELVMDYQTYLRRTLWPWSPPGVHLIGSGSTNRLSAEAFAQQTEALARELLALGEPRLATSR